MQRTRFEIRFNDAPLPPAGWGPRGVDTSEFFVSPNPGEDLRPLARVVSGGEPLGRCSNPQLEGRRDRG